MEEFNHIMFFEDGHKYVNMEDRSTYMSVTQLIEKVKPDVNWDFWAVYKHLQDVTGAKPRHNKDKETLFYKNKWVHYSRFSKEAEAKRKEWNDKADVAKERGTFLHLYLENLFNNKVIAIPNGYSVRGANRFYKDHRHLKPVYAEMIVGDDQYMIAGQVDRPFLVKPGVIDIYDFKTDEEIKQSNRFESLKAPVNDLDDCNFSKYTLQLNLYRWIIEKNTKYKVRNLKIVHITDTDYILYAIPKYDVSTLVNEIRGTHKQPEACH